jgi:hypothetical protein
MTKLEQVARAMWEQRRQTAASEGIELEEWGDGTIPAANWIFPELRAALLALKCPTDSMIEAGTWAELPRLAARFDAMIDDVLKEGHTP